MSNEQKLREALQHAIEDLSSATGFLTRRSRDRQSKTVAALAQLQADIALPTADHIPDVGKMVNGLTKAETDASASVSGLTAAPEMPLSMNQFGRLVELTREHLSDNTFVYKATSSSGETCHFGVESAAKAWAKGGTVEAIKVREFKLHTSAPTAAPVCEREAFEREMSKPPFEFCMDRWPDDGSSYAWPGNYTAYHTQCAWDAWQVFAALSAGDTVDAQRYRWLREQNDDDFSFAVVKNPHFDVYESPEELDAAIDAAMRKDKL